MSKCNSCGSDIKWIKTEAGKNMPVDVELIAVKPSQAGNIIIVTDSGRVVKGFKIDLAELATGTAIAGHISHFATCPFATQHRRR